MPDLFSRTLVKIHLKNFSSEILQDNEAHIFMGDTESIATPLEILSEDEKERSYKFRFQNERGMFNTSHAALRKILSAYTGLPPAEIIFQVNETGKPFLLNGDFHFNLSHSKNKFIIGICKKEIGVDVEFIKENFDFKSVMQNYFSENEQIDISHADSPERKFFSYWAKKEAIIKYFGTGIQQKLTLIDLSTAVTLFEGNGTAIAVTGFETDDFCCAVAVPDAIDALHFFTAF